MKKIVYLLLTAIMCFALCGCSNEKAANALKDAIYLEKPVINAANEGKIVIIHGYANMSKGAQDLDLGLSFDSPVVTRNVQILEAQTKSTTTTTTTNNKTDKKEVKKTTEYVWKDVNVKNNKTPFKTETFTGEAKIGDFTITGNPLKVMFNNKNITVTREMATRAGLNYWKQGISKAFMTTRRISDRFMTTNSELKAQNEGASRISYVGKEKQSKSDYTVAGVQQNGKLVSTKEFTIQYYAGNLSKEQMIEKNK
ncbi:MAG: hypothetical protein MJ050_00665 [Phascolarctobacterium sp.]|nr:hypothetical protein [Phascolarctobacterium sp.]